MEIDILSTNSVGIGIEVNQLFWLSVKAKDPEYAAEVDKINMLLTVACAGNIDEKNRLIVVDDYLANMSAEVAEYYQIVKWGVGKNSIVIAIGDFVVQFIAVTAERYKGKLYTAEVAEFFSIIELAKSNQNQAVMQLQKLLNCRLQSAVYFITSALAIDLSFDGFWINKPYKNDKVLIEVKPTNVVLRSYISGEFTDV